jgi:hypothetical protein
MGTVLKCSRAHLRVFAFEGVIFDQVERKRRAASDLNSWAQVVEAIGSIVHPEPQGDEA